MIENATRSAWRQGKVTAPSRTQGDRDQSPTNRVERTLSNRARRAQLFHTIFAMRHSNKEGARELLRTSHLQDEFDRQLIQQHTYWIDTPWGRQRAQGAIIDLTRSPLWPAERQKPSLPPIFFIPAFSGDLYGIAPLMRELALQGRMIVSIAYPESPTGEPTPAFADAVAAASDFTPHAEFFANAYDQITAAAGGQPSDAVELWGYSTGAALAATLLTQPRWQERVTAARLIYPASLTDRSPLGTMMGAARDYLRMDRSHLYDAGIVIGPREGKPSSLRKRIADKVMRLVGTRLDMYARMKLARLGRNIVVVAGERDATTQGWRAAEHFAGHNQVVVQEMPGARHMDALTQAAEVVALVER